MNHKKNNTKITTSGFTLIELLVVIAIIGLLSSVTLASLQVARQKATDTKVLAELNQMRIALEIYYLENGNYPGLTTNSLDTTENFLADSDTDTESIKKARPGTFAVYNLPYFNTDDFSAYCIGGTSCKFAGEQVYTEVQDFPYTPSDPDYKINDDNQGFVYFVPKDKTKLPLIGFATSKEVRTTEVGTWTIEYSSSS